MSENEITMMVRQLNRDVIDGFAEINSQLTDIKKDLRQINMRIGTLADQMLTITTEHRDFEKRLTKLEGDSGIQ